MGAPTAGLRLRWLASVGWTLLSAAVVLMATLSPVAGGDGRGSVSCFLVCGDRMGADILANILLFLPLGIGLGLLRLQPHAVFLVGLIVSGSIELAQIDLVSGRDANPVDVIANCLGTVLGGMVGSRWRLWMRPPPLKAGRLLAVWGAGMVVIAAVVGPLFSAVPGDGRYEVRWTRGTQRYAAYPGAVLAASIGDHSIYADVVTPLSAATALARGVPLEVRVQVRRAPSDMAHLLSLSRGEADLLFLGFYQEDLVLRYSAAAGYLSLEQPSIRLENVHTELMAGDTLTVIIRRDRVGYCLRARSSEVCSRPSAADAWLLLQNAAQFSNWVRTRVSIAWVMLMMVPIGLWSRGNRTTAVILICIGIAFGSLPALAGMAPLSRAECAGAVAAWLLGAGIHWYSTRLQSAFSHTASGAPDSARPV